MRPRFTLGAAAAAGAGHGDADEDGDGESDRSGDRVYTEVNTEEGGIRIPIPIASNRVHSHYTSLYGFAQAGLQNGESSQGPTFGTASESFSIPQLAEHFLNGSDWPCGSCTGRRCGISRISCACSSCQRWPSILTQAMVVATSIGVCSAYLVFCADLLDNVICGTGASTAREGAHAGNSVEEGAATSGLGIGWVFVLLPLETVLCSLTDVRSLQVTTVLGDVAVAGKWQPVQLQVLYM